MIEILLRTHERGSFEKIFRVKKPNTNTEYIYIFSILTRLQIVEHKRFFIYYFLKQNIYFKIYN